MGCAKELVHPKQHMKNIVEFVDVKNKCSFYSKEENLVRKGIMNFIIDNNKAFNVKNDLEALGHLNIEKINEKIESLIKNNGLVINENDEVIFAYPVSALPTNHIVTMEDGRTFSAMCAIDAMGTAFTFNQNVRINSKCSNTGEEVCVVIESGKVTHYVPKTLHALHVDLNKFKNWGASC